MYTMRFQYFYIAFFFEYCGAIIDGWKNVYPRCRNNENEPVDWWYIYKPPAEVFPVLGLNFSYITSDTAGQWLASNNTIIKKSMLMNTLMPMYKREFINHLAVAVYQNRYEKLGRTAARGVLMADVMGGLLLTHTVPGFPDIRKDRPIFPPAEAVNGHLFVCVSLGWKEINKVAHALHIILPNFTYVKIPEELNKLAQEWNFGSTIPNLRRALVDVHLKVKGAKRASLLVRPPGAKTCLYRTFAKNHRVNLNVYGQSRNNYLTTVCSQDFGVRNIDTISLKYYDEVHYVGNYTDQTWFAVSTAASWQQKGAGPTQYWTCTSNVDKEDLSGEAGLLLCIEDYSLWRTFDNLKGKEPLC